MSNKSGYQVCGNAAEDYEQINAFMLPWAENLVASANLTAGERVLDLTCGTGLSDGGGGRECHRLDVRVRQRLSWQSM